MKFNYSNVPQGPNPEPEYNKPYGQPLPPVQARGNLTYLEFIDVVDHFWKLGHPDISFGPYGKQQIFDPELGYIIYALDDKRTATNHPKPRMFEVKDVGDKKLAIYIENFNVYVKFTAIHKNPRIAEEIVEEFEEFMMSMISVFRMLGVENIFYARRLSDSHETRYGDDVSSRSVIYQVGLQKIFVEELSKLQEVYIQAQVLLTHSATPVISYATPPHVVFTGILDNHTSNI